jgi:hypothetical protein
MNFKVLAALFAFDSNEGENFSTLFAIFGFSSIILTVRKTEAVVKPVMMMIIGAADCPESLEVLGLEVDESFLNNLWRDVHFGFDSIFSMIQTV